MQALEGVLVLANVTTVVILLCKCLLQISHHYTDFPFILLTRSKIVTPNVMSSLTQRQVHQRQVAKRAVCSSTDTASLLT